MLLLLFGVKVFGMWVMVVIGVEVLLVFDVWVFLFFVGCLIGIVGCCFLEIGVNGCFVFGVVVGKFGEFLGIGVVDGW